MRWNLKLSRLLRKKGLFFFFTAVIGLTAGRWIGDSMRTSKPAAEKSVPHLVQDLQRTDNSLDKAIQKAWAKMPTWFRNRLRKFTPISAASVRAAAAGALRDLGPDASQATSALTQVLSDSDSHVQQASLRALAAIAPQHEVPFQASSEFCGIRHPVGLSQMFRACADKPSQHWQQSAPEIPA